MTTPPPPPPGNGSNQPYDPSGSTPPPPQGPGPTGPSYGSAPGQPPQAPPPAPGGAPQGGSDKGKTMAIISVVTGGLGIIYCTCFLFSIAAVVLGVLARKEFQKTGKPDTLAKVGLGLGVAGIVIGLLIWILQLAGVWEPMTFNFETS